MSLLKHLFRMVLGQRRPTWSGTILTSELDGPLSIRRDAYGVPYIDATNDHDAFFALGFCHGQDRAGQLEITLRAIRGTLSEVVGKDGLSIDRLSRRVGFRKAGEAQLAAADEDIRQQLEAYAAGINHGLRVGAKRRPHEHALLGIQPTRWEAIDCQGFLVLLCFALAASWDVALARLRILALDGLDALQALEPTYPDWYRNAVPEDVADANFSHLLDDLNAFADIFGALGGSNAWAVAGRKTQSGRAIVANDPHLIPSAPSQWYLTRIKTPEWCAIGASFVGVPAIGVGHNYQAAWGLTAAHATNSDLFLEDIGPDGTSVRQGDTYAPCPVRREVIKVKGSPPVVEEVLITPRGPIVSPALEGAPHALSLSATWLNPRPYRGLLSLHKVKSPEDIHALFDQASVSTVSLVFAMADGTIGSEFSSELPIRKSGTGAIPLPGWEPEVGWTDAIVPHADLPYSIDPPCGFVATANNPPLPPGEGPYMGMDFLDGYRHQAISEALDRRDDWNLKAMLQMQNSYRSIPWEEIRDTILSIAPTEPLATTAISLLREWDGCVAPDSTAATVFEVFMVYLAQRIAQEVAPRSAATALGQGYSELLPYNLLFTRRMAHLSKLIRTQPPKLLTTSWSTLLEQGLSQAYGTLLKQLGSPGKKWEWGTARNLVLQHPFGKNKLLSGLFNSRPIRCGGDATTIAQAAVDFLNPRSNPVGVATCRVVIDVGAWENSRFIVLGGQSGNPFLPQYSDQIAAWERGEGIPIHTTEKDIERHTQWHLRLAPR